MTDRGAGILPEVRPRLFERFATGSGSTGLGLGLYLAHQIAEAHGGTCFVLALPTQPTWRPARWHQARNDGRPERQAGGRAISPCPAPCREEYRWSTPNDRPHQSHSRLLAALPADGYAALAPHLEPVTLAVKEPVHAPNQPIPHVL